MSFILRMVLILIVFAFVVYVVKSIARLTHRVRGAARDLRRLREQIEGPAATSAEMVRCAACGAFVASKDAVRISSGRTSEVFCSHDCVRSHVLK